MWTVIYVSQSIETAKKLIDVLLTNKVISKLRRTNNCKDVYKRQVHTHIQQFLKWQNMRRRQEWRLLR